MLDQATITVLGAGYVGLTTATLLAHSGHKVYLIEPNKERLDSIKSGKSFFFEEGLDPLIAQAVQSNTLTPTKSYKEAVSSSDFVFSCVGTPDKPDGSSNLEFVKVAAQQTAKYISKDSVYLQKSTVPVGTGAWVKDLLPKDVTYASNPEFLREGTALLDTLCFDRVVVGCHDQIAAQKIVNIYKSIQDNREVIAKLSETKIKPSNGEYIITSVESAELIKVTANAFLALKISFANNIAKLADKTGADITEIMNAVGSDTRIGRAFLNAGRGYGGGCFPKDVSGLISSAKENGVNLPIMEAAVEVNDSMPQYIIDKAKQALGGSIKGKQVAVLGLAFKAGTSDVRRSPGIAIANLLVNDGAKVVAYDPKANEEARKDLDNGVEIADSIEKAIHSSEAIFITTDWPTFLNIDLRTLGKNNPITIIDCVNMLSSSEVKESGLQYKGIGTK